MRNKKDDVVVENNLYIKIELTMDSLRKQEVGKRLSNPVI
jgi:hypothetical protein